MQCRADLRPDARKKEGVEPDVGVGGQPCLAAHVPVKRKPCEYVHLEPAPLLYRLADGRLEAVAQIEDDRRVDDPGDLAWSELQVVWLGAGRRQVLDVEAGATDSLGGVGEGIEGRNARVLPARASRAAAGEQECRDENE